MQPRLDSELIARGRNGDTPALSELFERYYASSIRVARRILRSDEEAYDAVQSAYLAAFTHFGSFRGDAHFNTWMTRIVKNQCFVYLRRPGRRTMYSNPEEKELRAAEAALANRTPTPEDLAWQAQVNAALSDAARKLPQRLRDVYSLCYVADLCVGEAAEELGLTAGATRTRLFRVQHRMKSELRKAFGRHPRYGVSGSPAIPPARIAA